MTLIHGFSAFYRSTVFWPIISLLALLLVNVVIDPSFLTIEIKGGHLFGSLIDIANRAAPIALLALGMTLVVATGGIDLSVGAIVAIAGSVSAYLISVSGIESVFGVIFITLFVSCIAGIWNGFLVTFIGIQPIIATLILMVAGRGVAQLITDGRVLTFNFPSFEFIGNGYVLGVPTPILIVLGMYGLTAWLMRATSLGLFIASVGANPKASYYLGMNEKFTKMFVYVFCGLCAGLAGMILAADIKGADANNAGLWSELDAILAVVIGGTALIGGTFHLWSTLVGVLLLQTITTTILTNGIPAQFTFVIKSVVVVVVMLFLSAKFRRSIQAALIKGKKNAG
ncbi:ABC transporter permease [Grimontia sp. NTOU-MAR1]|uniref:ABC transporter permease n=1 Tax=Grimontia sp. NTOU-MAR1 TaxID=3111011 RepID=UPI002DB7BF16|nr:ABC transporter permease [Grimontia sp. NTOU-MAR1]WRV99838.1 ABC transporter permease [Grimontia sp. NTOU-MAR1]